MERYETGASGAEYNFTLRPELKEGVFSGDFNHFGAREPQPGLRGTECRAIKVYATNTTDGLSGQS